MDVLDGTGLWSVTDDAGGGGPPEAEPDQFDIAEPALAEHFYRLAHLRPMRFALALLCRRLAYSLSR